MLTRELNLHSLGSLIGAGTKQAGDFFFFFFHAKVLTPLFKLSSVFWDLSLITFPAHNLTYGAALCNCDI